MKSITQYLTRPHLCPFCGSTNVTAKIGNLSIWPDRMDLPVSCGDCRGSWIKEFTVTGYLTAPDIQPPMKPDASWKNAGEAADSVVADVKRQMEKRNDD